MKAEVGCVQQYLTTKKVVSRKGYDGIGSSNSRGREADLYYRIKQEGCRVKGKEDGKEERVEK